ncbi:MAG: RNA polymerase sigma factor [Pseudomonadota bacterium]
MKKTSGAGSAALSIFVEDREDQITLARSFVRNSAVAEELVQDSWLRWHGRGYKETDARSIFRTIVANLARDWWRRDKVERTVFDVLAMAPDAAPNTEHVVIVKDDLARVLAALRRMPTRTRAAFRMRWLDGCSFAEIGRRLNVSKPRAH